MDSLLLGSFHKPSLLTQGENGWRKENINRGCFFGCDGAVEFSMHDSKMWSILFWNRLISCDVSRCRTRKMVEKYCIERSQQHLLKHHVKGIGKRSTFYQWQDKTCLVNAATGHPFESDPGAYNKKSIWYSVKNGLDAFYRFSRPHTVIGTALSIVSVSLLAVEKLSDFSPLFFTGVLEAVAAALFMNIYIVGLNQLYDIDIDKVNKPYLPLASGEYSVRTGIMIVSSFSIMFEVLSIASGFLFEGILIITLLFQSFFLGWIVGSWPLFWALFISFMLGTAYSIKLPMLRWKRFALVAAMCILAVRAVIVQLAFFLHMQMHVYKRPAAFSRPLIFATAFMSFFSVVIALFKDIPDIDGDKIYGIQSFTVRLGQKRVFWICISLLEMAYGVAIMVGASSGYFWSKIITVMLTFFSVGIDDLHFIVLGHIILASILWNQAKSVDLNSKAAITSYYMFIWKLFYAEYLLIPLVR
ncbi:hypothetical protein FEM48_Zijuj01G0011400 [Ziziphus jujuba var. spinosa]|uniref:Homogentisate phytyltransferase 1, chloroplastic n=1 Tax=Ziziphus jujuba var. spinosa TaxID=714518 RepID=A0A978VY95_ZIZJJ|nr:hypothetical protein FEM48_Zijuj01G0011400 [Ziziphus jujuba var. spinosa]